MYKRQEPAQPQQAEAGSFQAEQAAYEPAQPDGYKRQEVVKKNVLFYEERTIHDSSLSYCAHAQACAAIGETELSWEFFKKCMVIDLDDNPNDTTDGIHAASLGGIWSCVIFGFAGISFSDGRLNVSPRLPKHWKEMRFSVTVSYTHLIPDLLMPCWHQV